MSPPTLVLSREQVDIPVDCPVLEVVQFECAFFDGDKEYTCVPFTRRFRACETALGLRRYEITDETLRGDIKQATKEMLSMAR